MSEMQKFNKGDFVHFHVGSDVYPGVVTFVSKNGKTVKVGEVRWRACGYGDAPTQRVVPRYVQGARFTIEDVVVEACQIEGGRTFRSRAGAQHKEAKSRSCWLSPGFESYYDPHF